MLTQPAPPKRKFLSLASGHLGLPGRLSLVADRHAIEGELSPCRMTTVYLAEDLTERRESLLQHKEPFP